MTNDKLIMKLTSALAALEGYTSNLDCAVNKGYVDRLNSYYMKNLKDAVEETVIALKG